MLARLRILLIAALLALAAAPAPAVAGTGDAARAMAMMWEMMRWFFANGGNGGSPASWASPLGAGPWTGLGSTPLNSWSGGPWSSAGGPWSNVGGPWSSFGGGNGFGGPWDSFGGGNGGPSDSFRGGNGYTGARLNGTWESANGEVLAIDNGRFMLSSSGRVIAGMLERRGDRLLAYVPSAQASQEYRFFEGNGLLVLIDPYGRSLTFRRLR